MKQIAVLLSAVLLTSSLSGCAGTTTDQYNDSHPKGVAYYDQAGKFHPAEPEAVSPKSQDGWETLGWIVGGAAAVAGLVLGIVTATK